jgi:HK97 family phage prohead protease
MENIKSFRTAIKADEAGKGRAVFATMNVIDKDGDVTIPGAFGMQTAKMVGAHDWAAPSIGLAQVSEDGAEAVADFQLNLDMASGKEWYESLKFNSENGLTQEFSYGFNILKESFEQREGRQVRILEKLEVFEVSPVMMGAGTNTRLLSMKADESRKLEEHFQEVLRLNEELVKRVEGLAALRKEKGKGLNDLNRSRLDELLLQNESLAAGMTALLAPAIDEDLVLVELEADLALRNQRLNRR